MEGDGVHALAAEVVRERAVILHVQKRRADRERLVGTVMVVVVVVGAMVMVVGEGCLALA